MPEPSLIRETLPDDCPRLEAEDTFTFRCGKDLDCFTKCCCDVSIVLTPYDVLRMKKALRLDSSKFLEKYTLLTCTRKQRLPIVFLKMDPESKKCPFLAQEGCEVYSDRPWACRMYPLGLAEPRQSSPTNHAFCFVVHEDLCHGHGKGRTLTAAEWMTNQEVEPYEAMGESFKRLMLSEFWQKDEALPPEKVEMYIMACYDLDRFRRFVFESRFLELFEVAEERVEALRTDDEEVLDFAMDWLRFSLFGEKRMKIRRSVWEAKAQALSDAQPEPTSVSADGKPVESVLFVQCAGSRDQNHLPYCSSLCCMTTLKQADLVHQQSGKTKVFIIYQDIITPGQYEQYYKKVQNHPATFLTKGEVAGVHQDGSGQLLVDVNNTLLGEAIRIPVDMVVLATGLVPNAPDNDAIRDLRDAKAQVLRNESETQRTSVFTLFLYAPYSKFAHVVYRTVAMAAAWEKGRQNGEVKEGSAGSN